MADENERVAACTNSASTQSPEVETAFIEDMRRLQEELELTRRENKQCWQHVQQLEMTVARMRWSAQCSKDQRDRLKKKVRELQTRLSIASPAVSHSSSKINCGSDRGEEAQDAPKIPNQDTEFRSPTPAVTPKVAERIRLKRHPSDDVHGSELCSLGVSNIRLAEHLAEKVHEESQLQELYHSLVSSARKQEFEIELENLRVQASRMKSQVLFLELTLNESRTLSDNLSSLCAQLESNETALQLALLFDDYVEQASDCLLKLADSQLALVLASCQAMHCDNGEDNNELLSLARTECEKAESEAKVILKRLDADCTTLVADNSYRLEAAVGKVLEDERSWSRSDENRLRSLIQIMKAHRDAVRRSVVEIQSTSATLNSAFIYGEGKQITSLQEEKLSLENVVLLQELMSVKEVKTQLKAKALVLEKENEILALTLRGKDMQLVSMQQEIENSGGDAKKIGIQDDNSVAEDAQTASQTSESIMANQMLLQRKSEYLIEHLKRLNESLMGKLERSKRKHKMKLRRLQQALRYVSEQYEMEISAIRGQLPTDAVRDSGNETAWSNTSAA